MARKSRQSNRTQPSEVQTKCIEANSAPDSDPPEILLSIAEKCDANSETLQFLLDHVSELHAKVHESAAAGVLNEVTVESQTEFSDEHFVELERLRDQVSEMEIQVQQLEQQKEDLASRLASHNVEASVGADNSSSDETLSWEERKELMLRQMEEDSFDAESFIDSLNTADEETPLDPVQYVKQLQEELDRRGEELEDRQNQIHELQHLLDQQSETRDGGLAIGAAAITGMFDSDELVREERERLQHMQEEWEEKFRQAEIEASLERAKLSRERQEVARKMAELEEQLAHAKRDSRHGSSDEDGTSRRWLAKLGLADQSG